MSEDTRSRGLNPQAKLKKKYKQIVILFPKLFKRATTSGDKRELLALLGDCYSRELRSFLKDNPDVFNEVCKAGYVDVAHILVEHGADVNMVCNGRTPLQDATITGNTELVNYLLHNGAELSRDVWMETSPLYLASINGYYDVVVALTDAFPSHVTSRESIKSLLFAAARGGNLDIVKFWYKPQMDLNTPVQPGNFSENSEDMVPLHAACEGKHLSVAKFLVENGAAIAGNIGQRFPEITSQLVEGCFHQYRNKMYTAQLRDAGLNRISDMWFEPYRNLLTTLDLSGNKLKVLSSMIPWGLPRLHTMNLSNNKLQFLDGPEDSMKCENLKIVDLSNNQLEEVCADLFCLSSLTNLDLSNNKLQYLIRPNHIQPEPHWSGHETEESLNGRWNLQHLTNLKVCGNNLMMISSAIRTCCSLTYLDASDNDLVAFVTPWECPLRYLNLSENYLESFPKNVERFWSGSLEELYLQGNCLQIVGKSVVKLTKLRILNLSTNNIECLPKPSVWELRDLESLNLTNNNLGVPEPDSPVSPKSTKGKKGVMDIVHKLHDVKQLEFPGQLSLSLKNLYLGNNNLNQVPPSVCRLQSLCLLDISQNPLMRTLPPELGFLTQCKQLVLTDNAITDRNIPDSLLLPLIYMEQSQPPVSATKDLLKHLRRLCRKWECNNRLKLVVLGPQDKGKSTLLNILNRKSGISHDHGNKIQISEWRLQIQKLLSINKPDILFNVWELQGHPDLKIIHQCFLTRNALYLLVFDLRRDYQHLQEWLCQIQSIANHGSVILVGTFYDKLEPARREDCMREYANMKEIFPVIRCFQYVSCVTKAGITDLKKIIYSAGLNMTNVHSRVKEKYVGMKIPKSYQLLMEKIEKKKTGLGKLDQPPILTEEGFYILLEELPDNEIIALDDVNNALGYLVEVGCLLHFNEQLTGLNLVYFLDPVWLQDTLALVLIDRGRTVSTATIAMPVIQERFNKEKVPEQLRLQCIQILKKFEVAMEIDNGKKLLVPSKLPTEQPMILADITENEQSRKIYRLYKLTYIPPGLWSRLIIRLLTATERFSRTPWFLANKRNSERMSPKIRHSESRQGLAIKDKDIMYWKQGIRVAYETGFFLLESVNYHIPDCEDVGIGILITTVSQDQRSLSPIGVIVDELDDILRDYFPGFQDSVDEFPCVHAVCPACYKSVKDESGIVVHIDHFDVQTCALTVLNKRDITCPRGMKVSLEDLVPEMLFKELPKRFFLEPSKVSIGETPLGSGGEGAVFPGKYGESDVVFKIYHKIKSTLGQGSVDSGRYTESISTQGSHYYMTINRTSTITSDMDEAKRFKAYKAFSVVRKEVAVLSKLCHPCIVSFLGLCVRPDLFLVMERVQLGSLRQVLDRQITDRTFNKFLDKHKTNSSVFSKDLTFKIIYQVAKGLEYLHEHSIIYRDLKSANVLVCSLDVTDVVNVKLSDYGISQFSTSQGLSGMVGTLGYMAPEILNKQIYTEKVDIFSFSMLMSEVLCGQRPYDNSLNITQAVTEEKKRPDMKEFSIVSHFPYMEYLMSVCWDHDASKRPSAADIVKYMRQHQFVCQHETIPGTGDMFSEVTCASVTLETDADSSSKHFLWFWGERKNGSERSYSVYSLDTSTYHVVNKTYPGGKVRCMLQVDDSVWVGTEASEIEIFGCEMGEVTLLEETLAVSAVPTVLLYSTQGDSKDYVFAGLANGSVAIFLHGVQQNTYRKTLTLCLDVSVSGMTLVSQGRELWISCGHMIEIINTQTLLKEEKIDVSGDASNNFQIQHLVSDGDRVWCSFRNSSLILEYDAELKHIMYSLEIDNTVLHCKQVQVTETTSLDTDSESSSASEVDNVTESGSVSKVDVVKRETSVSSPISHESLKITEMNDVTNLLLVHDTLWIGTGNGNIIVTGIQNTKSDNPRPRLTVIESLFGDQGKGRPVDMLISVGDLVLSGCLTETEGYIADAAWEASGSGRLGTVGRLWKGLDNGKENDL